MYGTYEYITRCQEVLTSDLKGAEPRVCMVHTNALQDVRRY